MARMRKNGWLTAVMLAVFVVSGVRVFGRATVREPMVRFSDFYIAAQKADTRRVQRRPRAHAGARRRRAVRVAS